jgi:hypothetical protein
MVGWHFSGIPGTGFHSNSGARGYNPARSELIKTAFAICIEDRFDSFFPEILVPQREGGFHSFGERRGVYIAYDNQSPAGHFFQLLMKTMSGGVSLKPRGRYLPSNTLDIFGEVAIPADRIGRFQVMNFKIRPPNYHVIPLLYFR